jgi:DNA topoisomerase-3
MDKTLVIAEKPSVASDIAKALGGFKKGNDVYERDDMVITSAVGHLLDMIVPEKHDIKRGKWTFKHLPHIPSSFGLAPFSKTEAKLKTILKQIKRKDIKLLINACDAAREGELIFRRIIEHSKSKLEIKRLWLQSMTAESIREGFKNLKPNSELLPLAEAAQSRSEADWLIGINGTRAFTAFNSQDGGFYKTPVGRVKTPTLAMVVDREKEISSFVSEPFQEINVTFKTENGVYDGKWFDEKFKKDKENPEFRADRIWDKNLTDKIITVIQDKIAKFKDELKTSYQSPPQLFDLTSLQRDANSRFGFSAKNSLGLAQSLYDKHKVITYPRTDSKALPEDYIKTVKETLNDLAEIPELSKFCKEALSSNLITLDNRIFDNKRVSDHFAIIPTGVVPKKLSEPEQKIFDLIIKRFISNFFPPAKFFNTKRITTVENYFFKTEGKILTEPGWLSIYLTNKENQKNNLIKISDNEKISVDKIEKIDNKTKPPPHYSEATLLSSMETAGKLVKDENQREAMAEKGIGTPATRSEIIEGLIRDRYLIREGRDLLISHEALRLMHLLKALNVNELCRADLTGEWEFKLKEIENGKINRETFINEIKKTVSEIIEKAQTYTSSTIPGEYSTLKEPCPSCGETVKETYKRYSCLKCDFSISKTPGSRILTVNEAEEFIKNKKLGPLEGYRNKWGALYVGTIILTDENKLKFDFGTSDEEELTEIDLANSDYVGYCPKCSNNVFLHKNRYICEKSVGKNKLCDFKSGLSILQQSISLDQMKKLLENGKTDLLDGFISSRTKRKFKAFLVKKEDGTIGFEFLSKQKK